MKKFTSVPLSKIGKITAVLCLSLFFSINGYSQDFTWTDINGDDFTTPGVDQRVQGPCYVHSVTALIESVYEIENGLPEYNMNLSEAYLYSNCVLDFAYSSNQIYKTLDHIRYAGALCQPDHPDYLPTCISAPDEAFNDCVSCFFDYLEPSDCGFIPPFCPNNDCTPACVGQDQMAIENNCFFTQGYTISEEDDCLWYTKTPSQSRVSVRNILAYNYFDASAPPSEQDVKNLIMDRPFIVHFTDGAIHNVNGNAFDHSYLVVGWKVVNGNTLWQVKDSWPGMNTNFHYIDVNLPAIMYGGISWSVSEVYCESRDGEFWVEAECSCGNVPYECSPHQNPNVGVTYGGLSHYNPTSNLDVCFSEADNWITIDVLNDPVYLEECVELIEWDAIGIGGSSANPSTINLIPLGNGSSCDVEFLQDGTYGISVRFKYTDGTFSAKRWVYVDFTWDCEPGGGGGGEMIAYPNPAQPYESVWINLNRFKEQSTSNFVILDFSGQIVFQKILNPGVSQFQIDGLKQGIYFTQVINRNGEIIFGKLIVR